MTKTNDKPTEPEAVEDSSLDVEEEQEDTENEEALGLSIGRIQAGGEIHIYNTLDTLSTTAPGDIQKIAASQIKLLYGYYNTGLDQAKSSFRWALVAASIGFLFFLGAIIAYTIPRSEFATIIATIGGGIAEFIAAVNFWLYARTIRQLNHFHDRLDRLQRFLLANSICESLDGDLKQEARYNLVATIASFDQRTAVFQRRCGEEEVETTARKRPREG